MVANIESAEKPLVFLHFHTVPLKKVNNFLCGILNLQTLNRIINWLPSEYRHRCNELHNHRSADPSKSGS